MLENLDDFARSVVVSARRNAAKHGQSHTRAEHLVLEMVGRIHDVNRAFECLDVAPKRLQARMIDALKQLPMTQDSASLDGLLPTAWDEARKLGKQSIGVEHLLLAIMKRGDSEAAEVLREYGIWAQPLIRALDYLRDGTLIHQIQDIIERNADGKGFVLTPAMWALRGMCVSASVECFNGRLKQTESTAVREREVRRVLQVLSRNTKRNTVLIGEPGVGKSEVLDDLARWFAAQQITATLTNSELFWAKWDDIQLLSGIGHNNQTWLTKTFDIGALHDGVIFLLDDVVRHMDFEAHLGSRNAATSLWRHLSTSRFQTVMTMTPAEYARFAATSPLHRFFEPVRIPELSTDQTVTVLNSGIRQRFQEHHFVHIGYEAMRTAANLADRYMPDQFLPSKAVTLLDEACATVQTARLGFDQPGGQGDGRPGFSSHSSPDFDLVDAAIVRSTLAELKGIPVAELHSTEPPVTGAPSAAPATAATRLPHRPTSTALLLGTAHYAHPALLDTSNISNNLLDLHRRFTDPRNGSFDPDRVHQPDGDLGMHHIPALVQAARSATDTLLVYYSGHGFIADDGQLHLGLTTTDPELWEYTALPYDQLRKAVRDAPARNKILILDCCFAGRAIDDLSDTDSSGQLDIEGTYVLTATTATRTAHASDGADHTAFTGALLHVLGEGIDETEELIKLSAIYSRLDRRLIAKGLPKPQQRGTNNIHNLALTRNPRWNRNLTT